jgi:hypothetical protein
MVFLVATRYAPSQETARVVLFACVGYGAGQATKNTGTRDKTKTRESRQETDLLLTTD